MMHSAKEGCGVKRYRRGRRRVLRLPEDALMVACSVVVGVLALQAKIRVDISAGGVLAFVGDARVVGSHALRAHRGRCSRHVAGFPPRQSSLSSAREVQSSGRAERVCGGHLRTAGSGDSNLVGQAQEEPVYTLLIDNYDSYTYNLYQQLAVINGRAPFVVYNDDEGGDLRYVCVCVVTLLWLGRMSPSCRCRLVVGVFSKSATRTWQAGANRFNPGNVSSPSVGLLDAVCSACKASGDAASRTR